MIWQGCWRVWPTIWKNATRGAAVGRDGWIRRWWASWRFAVFVALLVFVMPQIVAAFAQTKRSSLVDPQLLLGHRTAPVRNLAIALLLAASVFAPGRCVARYASVG